jgi:hypothetical protein
MTGRPDFTTPGSGGSGQRVAVSNRPEVQVITASQTDDISAGGTELIDVFAPSGSVYRVKAMSIDIDPPGSATTGAHSIGMRSASASALSSMKGKSEYSARLFFQYSYWENSSANGYPKPPTNEAQIMAIQNALATENQPLRFKYVNDTDVVQSNERKIKLVVEEESY